MLDLSPNDPESAVEETVFQTEEESEEEVEVSDEGFVDVPEETIGSLLDYNEIQSPSTSEEVPSDQVAGLQVVSPPDPETDMGTTLITVWCRISLIAIVAYLYLNNICK